MTGTLHPTAPPDADPLPDDVLAAVLSRLGLPADPEPTAATLQRLYRAWCARVPYDNGRIRRSLTERPGEPVVGVGAARLLADNLAYGNASQCTETANALHALLRALGFDAVLCLANYNLTATAPLMVNHVTVLVRLDDDTVLADTVMLTERPVPLREHTARYGPLEYAVSRDGAGSWRLDSVTPVGRTPMTTRLFAVADGPQVCGEVYRNVQDEGFADFNGGFFARRSVAGTMITFSSGRDRRAALHRTTADGTTSVARTTADEREQALRTELGFSAEFVRGLPPDTPASSSR